MERLETKELDQRQSDKYTITLWWVIGTIDTFVTVADYDAHEETVIDIPEGKLPHEIYNHPFAYMPRTSDVR